MPGPTNTQLGLAPIDQDTEETVREMCAAQGCTCGDRLVVQMRPATAEEVKQLPAGGKHSVVNVTHGEECPLLAATRTN